MAKIARFFEDVFVPDTGLEIKNIILNNTNSRSQNSLRNRHTGTINQVVMEMVGGAATSVDVQIRYLTGVSDRDKLAYLFEAGDLPIFVDSDIAGPFSVRDPGIDGDLHLFILPDASCTLNIRVDIDINNLSGK